MFFDLHTHTNLSIGENSLEDMAGMAKKLGLGGVGVVRYYSSAMKDLPKIDDFEVVNAVIIKVDKPEDLDDIAKKVRKKFRILMVHGGSYEINRAACENSMIDVISHPELGRNDSGLDHICAKAARDNDVAIEVNFREVLESYKRKRIKILAGMRKNVRLCKKYEADIITVSGAVTKWGLRGGRELAAVTHVLGADLQKAIASVSSVPEKIIKENEEKLSNKRQKGVRLVE